MSRRACTVQPSAMSAAQVRNLLQPPVQEISQEVTKDIFDSQFRSIEDLEKIDVLVQEACVRYEQLTLEVRIILPSFSSLSQ